VQVEGNEDIEVFCERDERRIGAAGVPRLADVNDPVMMGGEICNQALVE